MQQIVDLQLFVRVNDENTINIYLVSIISLNLFAWKEKKITANNQCCNLGVNKPLTYVMILW